ncbi:hypothetical protein [Nostoc sp.]
MNNCCDADVGQLPKRACGLKPSLNSPTLREAGATVGQNHPWSL